MLIILFLVLHFNFLFVPCGRLSWLPVSILLHVKYTLSYRIVSYLGSPCCPYPTLESPLLLDITTIQQHGRRLRATWRDATTTYTTLDGRRQWLDVLHHETRNHRRARIYMDMLSTAFKIRKKLGKNKRHRESKARTYAIAAPSTFVIPDSAVTWRTRMKTRIFLSPEHIHTRSSAVAERPRMLHLIEYFANSRSLKVIWNDTHE